MPSVSQEVINEQLENRVERQGDEYLCRRCSSVVPDEFRYVYYLDSMPGVVWGPYCSEECICYGKICSSCNKDFIVDDPDQIKYFGDGKWLCFECSKDIVHCENCNSLMENEDQLTLADDGKKVCDTCMSNHYFECPTCDKLKHKGTLARNSKEGREIAEYPSLALSCSDCFDKKKKDLDPLPVVECKRCGGIAPDNETMNGYCHSCIQGGYVSPCTNCGTHEDNNQMMVDDFGSRICQKCKPKFSKCSNCTRLELRGKMKIVNGRRVHKICSTCYSSDMKECTICLKISNSNNFMSFVKADGVQRECCSNCYTNKRWCDDCKDFHCEEPTCRDELEGRLNYGYRPAPVFNHAEVSHDRIFFGFENEMNFSSESKYRKAIRNVYDNFSASQIYLKSDASISGHGFEAVSHPMNLSYLKKFPVQHLFGIKPKKDDTSCGLHVHVERTAFISDVHLYKIVDFINNGSAPFIKKIAGRSYNHYADKISDKASSYVKKGTRRKYDAVNLSPRDTVEFRIFKGCKTEYQLRYRIEFVHALIVYMRTAPLSASKDQKSFIKWVRSNPRKYPSLYRFIKANY